MIHIRPIGPSDLPLYDTVDMLVHIDRIYQIEKIDRGLGGFRLRETPVPAYVKDMSRYERAQEYAQRFDITNWGFFLALDGDRPVGACTLAARRWNCGKVPELQVIYVDNLVSAFRNHIIC